MMRTRRSVFESATFISIGVIGIGGRPLVEQQLQRALDRRERRAQLVRHDRHELALQAIHLVQARDVLERHHAAR